MLCLGKFPVPNKFMDKKGEYQNCPWKLSCLTVPRNFVLEHFSVSLISDIEKNYASEAYATFFRQKFFV